MGISFIAMEWVNGEILDGAKIRLSACICDLNDFKRIEDILYVVKR